MYKVLVFAGTTEGYEISRFLAKYQVPVYVCTATDYGGKALEENGYLKVSPGRLDEKNMEELFREVNPQIILDATHPYAAEVTANTERRRGTGGTGSLCGIHGSSGRVLKRNAGKRTSHNRK